MPYQYQRPFAHKPANSPHPSIHPSSKLGHSRNVLDIGKLLAHLDNRVPNQPRIQTHGTAQLVLSARPGIEAHNEVVAVVMRRLQFLGRLRQQERAPVADTAHDAVLIQYNLAGGTGDSAKVG